MDQPWMKFFPRDWRGDQALRAVSLAARGLWIECLCIMHEARPYGHLMLNGVPVDDDTLARMTGISVDEVSALLTELRQAGVLSVTNKGVVRSRRMTKDHARARKGRSAANKRWSQVSDDVEQSDAPNGLPNRIPITQKPESRSQRQRAPGGSRRAVRPGPAAAMAVDPTRLATLLAEAACLGAAPPPWAGLTGPIEALLADGFSLEGDILPMIRRRRRPDIGSWAYYAAAIRGAAEAGRPPPSPAAVDEATWRARLAAFAADGYWPVGYGPEPGLEGCRVPGHLLGRGENEAGE